MNKRTSFLIFTGVVVLVMIFLLYAGFSRAETTGPGEGSKEKCGCCLPGE